jgi:hypothetical protein
MGWLGDRVNDARNVVDDAVDGVVDRITENVGTRDADLGSGEAPYEHALNMLVQTSWTIPVDTSMVDRAREADEETRKVVTMLEDPREFAGATADRAVQYGEHVEQIFSKMDLEETIADLNREISKANSVLDGLRSRTDELPGNRLDSFSEGLIGTLNVGACLVVPGLGVYELATGDNPVDAINSKLREKREDKAREILEDVRNEFPVAPIDASSVRRPTSLPDTTTIEPVKPWHDNDYNVPVIETTLRQSGARSLGGGRYDLDGDGVADYVDADGDGVPDYWLDRNGNRVSSDRVQGGIGVVSGAGVGSSGVPGSGQWGPGSVPLPVPGPGHAPVPMPDSGQSFAPSYPVGGGHVVDVDSVMTPGSAGFPGSTGMSGGAAGAGTVGGYASGVSPVSGMGMSGGLAVGAAGAVGAGVGVGVGSYFTNTPVRASVAPGGTLSGATGPGGRVEGVGSRVRPWWFGCGSVRA